MTGIETPKGQARAQLRGLDEPENQLEARTSQSLDWATTVAGGNVESAAIRLTLSL